MRLNMTTWLCALGLLACPCAGGYGDAITLDDGTVLEGEIVPGTGSGSTQTIDLQISTAGVVAIQHIDRRRVVHIAYGPTPHQLLVASLVAQGQALGPGGAAEDYLALALRAKAAGEAALMRRFAGAAVARDRHLTAAHQLLGEVQQNGVWMLPREAAIARGEVFYEGRWMSWDERQQLLDRLHSSQEAAAQRHAALLDAERQDQAAAALQEAAYGSSSHDPFSQDYVSGSSYGGGSFTYSASSYASGGVAGGYGTVGYVTPAWGRSYGTGSGGISGGLVISGSSHSSQWALGLHW